ncbi:MAG: FKBP-type peptidyl-prolyl cis-trans isomerase [Moheibacter sp.]
MKKIITTVVLATVIVSCNKSGGGNSHVTDKLENDDQKAGYAYGMTIGEQVLRYSESLKEDSLSYAELEKGILDYLNTDKKNRDSYANGQSVGLSISNFIKTQKLEGKIDEKYVVQGVMDILRKDSALFNKDSINSFMQKYIQDNVSRLKKENSEKGEKFLAEKKKDSKVKATESGLLYEVISEGNGALPTDKSVVEVNYTGKLIDGKVFDESKEGEAVKFPLNNVIKGWQEGLKLMKVGSKYKFYIPGNLAYGEYGSPDGKIGPDEVLVFDVELVGAEDAPEQEQAVQPGQQITPEQLKRLQEQAAQQGVGN